MSHRVDGSGNWLALPARLPQDQGMLVLPFECHRSLRGDVEKKYPEEACGVLLGHRDELDDRVARVMACANVDAEPKRRYSIAPADLVLAQRTAREAGMEILGFYHSHPDHAAEASESDLREANWTGCVYLICAVEKGKLTEVAAVRLVAVGEWEAERVHFGPPEG